MTALIQEDITVINLLESESNQDDDSDKFNRVDILLENQKKELIIIEVQARSEYDYFHRIVYGVSKLITDYIQKGQPYGELKKVISISIAYFNLGLGKDYLYYGSTRFIGVNQSDELKLTQNQEDKFGTEYVHKIFSEYYLIRVGEEERKTFRTYDRKIDVMVKNKINFFFFTNWYWITTFISAITLIYTTILTRNNKTKGYKKTKKKIKKRKK